MALITPESSSAFVLYMPLFLIMCRDQLKGSYFKMQVLACPLYQQQLILGMEQINQATNLKTEFQTVNLGLLMGISDCVGIRLSTHDKQSDLHWPLG